MKIKIDITERLYDVCCSNSAGMIMPFDVMLMKKAIQNGTPLPQEESDNAESKNMTNGDVFKELFPDVDVQEIRGHFGNTLLGYRTRCGERSQDYLLDWWNAPYERRSKKEKE